MFCAIRYAKLFFPVVTGESSNNVNMLYISCMSGGTFFIGFIIEYLAKLNAIILIIYSSRPFNVVCELQEFALRGSD